MQKNVQKLRKSISTSTDARLRNDIHRFCQKQHLTASLFALDEIAITPKVLTPLIQIPKSAEFEPTDSVSLTVPYTPDWPEMAALYQSSTMTLVEALQGRANIILVGHPGSGKTFALAWLASSISRNDPGLGNLQGLLPLYVHATDIYHFIRHKDAEPTTLETTGDGKSRKKPATPQKIAHSSSETVDALLRAISTYTSPITLSRLPRTVESALEQQRAILLIDRTDELPPNQSRVITEFILSLQNKYSQLRIVIALSYDDLAGLPAHGFSLLAMAGWTDYDREKLLNRWSELWDQWVAPPKHNEDEIRSYYLNSWLKVNNAMLKPIEYVLKVWAAYTGDIIGTDGPSAIEAYIRRMTSSSPSIRSSLELYALQLLYEMNTSSSPHDSEKVYSEYEKGTPSLGVKPAIDGTNSNHQAEKVKLPHVRSLSGIDNLLDNGFFVVDAASHYGFSHPIFSGYLAGNAIATIGNMDQVKDQPLWIGKSLAMYYFARVGDVTPYINKFIQEDDILHTNHLMISRWLQIAPKNRQWRSIILRTLTTILNKEKDTVSLAAKIISAMAFSGDVGVSVYFRQLLKSEHPNLKIMAALGCGILQEKKAIETLEVMLHEPSPPSIRSASLALAAIGDKQSLEILASCLLNGSEMSRRCAAEALANNPVEGHAALKEGSGMEDLLVRRSVAFGLIRVNLPWATKIVENLQLEDSEWVVRNAAIQAFAELQRKTSYAPSPLADPTETQWLIDYATRMGTTVAPGKPADDLVMKALANGTEEEIINALDYLRYKCDARTINSIFNAYTSSISDIKDAAYYVLWLMMISGIKLPVSVKYDIK